MDLYFTIELSRGSAAAVGIYPTAPCGRVRIAMPRLKLLKAAIREMTDKAEKPPLAGYLSNICRVAEKGGFRFIAADECDIINFRRSDLGAGRARGESLKFWVEGLEPLEVGTAR